MKIGVISNLYPPLIRGGGEIIAAHTAEGLKEAWQHVFVISTQPYANWQSFQTNRSEINDVLVYRFYPPNFYYYLNDYKFPWFIRVFWHLWDSFNIFSRQTVKNILKKSSRKW